jgi:hypothetical protein
LVERLRPPHSLPAPQVDGPVPDDREQPGTELLLRPAVFDAIERSQKCVLADVLRIGGVAQHRDRGGVRRA